MTSHPELMVNFVTSSYEPELLKFLVDKVSAFPEVVGIKFSNYFCLMNIHSTSASPHLLLSYHSKFLYSLMLGNKFCFS